VKIDFDRASHSYRVNGRAVPSVTQVLSPLEDFSRVPRHVLEAAREFGQHVHEACDLYNRGELDWLTLDSALTPYVEGWRQFIDETGAVILASEFPVAHDQLGYAGTPDVLIQMRDKLWIPDIKSTAIVPSTVGYQTAAYSKAYQRMTGQEPSRCCVLLTGDGRYKLHTRKETSDWEMFISALNCFKHKARHHHAA
jgi:hypothetical protein